MDGPTVALRQDALATRSPGTTAARIDLAAGIEARRRRLRGLTFLVAVLVIGGFVALLYTNLPSTRSSASGSSSGSATSAVADSSATTDDPAAALQARRAQDRAALARAKGSWLPQVSSKKVGLVADGITYDEAAIWNDFERVRAAHPEARLAYSGDWGSFRQGDYWVTLIYLPSAAAASANEWCDSQGYAKDQCYAKRVAGSGGFAGNTVTRN